MGRDYKDIVSGLWDRVPIMLEKAQITYDRLEEQYFEASIREDVDPFAVVELAVLEEKLYIAEMRLERCEEMMDSLENDEFLTIVENYFNGFFELDGEDDL